MRFLSVILIYILSLAGCVNYAGLKSKATPYDAPTLAAHHTYTPNKTNKTISCNHWWNKFHDPQLNELIATALADAPDMQIAQSRVSLAQNIADQSRAALLPSVNFDGMAAREHFTENTIIPPPYAGNTASYGFAALDFQYDLDFWGKK